MNIPILRFLNAIAITVLAWPGLVEANAPDGHYVVTAGSGADNGTVYDRKSKLTWQQTTPTAKYTWDASKTYCKSAAVGQSLGARAGAFRR